MISQRAPDIRAFLHLGHHQTTFDAPICTSQTGGGPTLQECFTHLEALLWHGDEHGSKNGAVECLGDSVCRFFPASTNEELFFGIVVAQTHPDDAEAFSRVVYQDGDCEDYDDAQLEEMLHLGGRL